MQARVLRSGIRATRPQYTEERISGFGHVWLWPVPIAPCTCDVQSVSYIYMYANMYNKMCMSM